MATIMVVDDEIETRDVVKDILESKGYTVSIAKDGDDCLKQVVKVKPDLILLDMLMPGLPIEKLLSKLKKYKVIIFSVVRLQEKSNLANDRKVVSPIDYSNVVGYIAKPFSIDNLLATIKKFVRIKEH
jgi:CheY-like chemotaxis protein